MTDAGNDAQFNIPVASGAKSSKNRPVANGSMWIQLEAPMSCREFEPGHVLGLGVNTIRATCAMPTPSAGPSRDRGASHLYRVIPDVG